MISSTIRFTGPLRAMLFAGIIAMAAAAAFSAGGMQTSGIMIFPTLIVPAVVPMIFFVLPLDMTMCAIMMSGKTDAEKKRYRKLILCDIVAMVLLFAAWWPFYSKLIFN